MKTICLYFEIHQIIHLKRYRFFEIGTDHYYYDDYANEQGINEVVERSYVPALSQWRRIQGSTLYFGSSIGTIGNSCSDSYRTVASVERYRLL